MQAQTQCVRMLESGPAAGVIGTQSLCRRLGIKNAIAFDMGGTTAKAGVIYQGDALTTGTALIGGYDKALPVQIAMMDIFEVGTGGGSIARADDGLLRVGPQSAGAQPGPACYGQGGKEPTITDANLMLGRLGADRFLGGEMKLDVSAAGQALLKVGKPLGMNAIEAADGILRIAATAMSYAVKGVTTERGLDAGDFVLVAYGGAGPLHAVDVAREIGIRNVIVPGAPGVFSAFGMLFSDLRYDYVRTHLMQLVEASFDEIEAVFQELEQNGRDAIAATSVKPHQIAVKRAFDMRYVGQEHPVTVELPARVFQKQDRAAIKRHFDNDHMRRYGTSAPSENAEIVSLRVTVAGLMKKPRQEKIKKGNSTPPKSSHTGTRKVWFDGRFRNARTYRRTELLAGNKISGPGAHRGTRLDHGADVGRSNGSRRLRQPGNSGRRSTLMVKRAKGAAVKKRKVDPVVIEIVRNGVLAVTEEMKTNLMRTAYNMIIYEALDFTTGLFTPTGETVSIGIGLPTFIRGMAETVKAKIRHFGVRNIKPGDIYVTNDAYTTGSHLNHFTFTLPIFHKGKLVAFSCCMAHWLDVGGVLGGMTTDIYSEGIQIPIVKYQDRGKVNQDLLDIIRMNVRLPPRAMGDLRAQVTAVKTGERRFLELLDRYGQQGVLDSIAEIMDRSEAAARARTLTIPDGVYEAESWLDDDGVDIGKRIPIKVKVTVDGDEMTIDLTDVSKQVRGFYNSAITTGYGCAQVAYKCITSPTDYPINDGAFRSLKIIIPKGRIISATRPAPMRLWMCFPMTIIDTIFKALQPAIPDRVIAGHHADLVAPTFHGFNPKTSEFFIGNFGPLGGGWGAKKSEDGVSATVCLNDGDTHNGPNEQAEAKFPILVERFELVPDSAGAGRYRGGLGVERTTRALSPIVVNTQSDRSKCPPWGLRRRR